MMVDDLSKEEPVFGSITEDASQIDVWGYNAPEILANVVGAISLYGVSIQGAVSENFTQNGVEYFHDTFSVDPQTLSIQKSKKIFTLIEKLAVLVFSKKNPKRARQIVVEFIAEEVELHSDIATLMPVVDVNLSRKKEKDGTFIYIEIQGKDRPFLLYMLCDVLAVHGLLVQTFEVNTFRATDNIHDVFVVQERSPAAQEDVDLRKLHFNILLSIKYSYFIQQAPNPYQATQRLQQIIHSMVLDKTTDIHSVIDLNSLVSRELAKILGSGDYVWEDFIRTNAGEFRKFLSKAEYKKKGLSIHEYESVLIERMKKGSSFEEQVMILNDFKNELRYHIDIDALILPENNFLSLSQNLSELAKVLVRQAIFLAEKEIQKSYGIPRSAAGLESRWVLFGLGKFGGAALGFASDIEVQLVFTDAGHTDGKTRIRNREYFDALLKMLSRVIRAKEMEIFKLDFRLRPHGEAGPPAVHINNFVDYYRSGGAAHSVERLALSRMRPIAGDHVTAEEIMKLRDTFIYFSSSIDPKEIIRVRQRQVDKRLKPGQRNAKIGAGALLDLEIHVQLLQVKYGKDIPELREPGMYNVLQQLDRIKDIAKEDIRQIQEAHDFFRTLINALRLRRGNARDVSLPPDDDWELTHLARRMGYKRSDLSTREQLLIDFDTHSAHVFRFIKTYTGKEAVRIRDMSPAALVYVDEGDYEQIPLLRVFQERKAALRAIKNSTKDGALQHEFARILLLSWQRIKRSGAADAIIVLFSRLSDSFSVEKLRTFYQSLLLQPGRLFILLEIFSGSRYLSEELLKKPEYIEDICKEEAAQKEKHLDEYSEELAQQCEHVKTHGEFLNVLREYKKQETLKIITQDICLAFPIEMIFHQISDLAVAIVQRAFTQICETQERSGKGIAVFAFGKLGAHELNYSSDIDLLCVYTQECSVEEEVVERMFLDTIACLFEYTESGRAYRVDLRLQPYGQNHTVISLKQLEEYYKDTADLWEIQASIKLSFIAGDEAASEEMLASLSKILEKRVQNIDSRTLFEGIDSLRKNAVEQLGLDASNILEIKQSWGGLRDIEFIVQGLQLLLYRDSKKAPKKDTLSALTDVKNAQLIGEHEHRFLTRDYCFLRRIEHFLQVYDDRQLHVIPEHDTLFKRRLTWLVVGEQDIDVLVRTLHIVKKRVSAWYASVLEKMSSGGAGADGSGADELSGKPGAGGAGESRAGEPSGETLT